MTLSRRLGSRPCWRRGSCSLQDGREVANLPGPEQICGSGKWLSTDCRGIWGTVVQPGICGFCVVRVTEKWSPGHFTCKVCEVTGDSAYIWGRHWQMSCHPCWEALSSCSTLLYSQRKLNSMLTIKWKCWRASIHYYRADMERWIWSWEVINC